MKESVGVTTGVENVIAASFRSSRDFFAVPDNRRAGFGVLFQSILLSSLVAASLRWEIALAIQLDFIGGVGSPR